MSIRIYQNPEEIPEAFKAGRAVAIGVFDGVHRGHQRIVREAVESAHAVSGRSATVVTFRPHPEAVLLPHPAPRLLTPMERKAEIMDGLGVDEMVVVRFDRDFARFSPADFCRVVLSRRLGARLVFVGENFRFGHKGAGRSADLESYGREHGFAVKTAPLAETDGKVISSTRIRNLVAVGQVEEAAALLGRPHRIEGLVASGAGRGRALNAPTANLTVGPETAVPCQGVYVTRSVIDGRGSYLSVTSIGTNPTFESDNKVRIETFLLDYSGDMYGRHLALDFLRWIRAQEAFADAEALTARIRDDVAVARSYAAGGGETD